MGMGTGQQPDAEDGAEVATADVEGEYKTSSIFPAGSMMNVLKMLTFHRKGPFDIKAEYADAGALPTGTPKELGTFRIELPPGTETKKIKVRAKLTLHGTFAIEGAQVVEEEEYEEVTKVKKELPADPAPAEGEAAAAPAEASPEAAEGE